MKKREEGETEEEVREDIELITKINSEKRNGVKGFERNNLFPLFIRSVPCHGRKGMVTSDNTL